MIANRAFFLVATALLLTIGILVSLLTPSFVRAQDKRGGLSCPVDPGLSAELLDPGVMVRADDVLSTQVHVTNSSEYTLSGVSVGVAAYTAAGEPQYWMILPGEYKLLPHFTMELPADIGLSVLHAGEYTLKAFATQGGATAVLGMILNDSADQRSVSLVKSQNPSLSYPTTIQIGDTVSSGEPVEVSAEAVMVKAVTTNDNQTPFTDGDLLLVITEGAVPLGTAVQAEKQSAVSLIPYAAQSIILRDQVFNNGQGYTVYAALMSDAVLQPITTVPINQSGEVSGLWPYVSVVGLSEYPLQADSIVVACVKVVNAGPEIDRFTEELGVSFSVLQDGEVEPTVEKIVYTTDVDTLDFVSFVPGVTAQDFTLSVDLLQLRHYAPYVENEEYSLKEFMRDSMSPVDNITQVFVCDGEKSCGRAAEKSDTAEDHGMGALFWFYVGVGMTAVVLMYLTSRRSRSEKVSVSPKPNLSSDELQ